MPLIDKCRRLFFRCNWSLAVFLAWTSLFFIFSVEPAFSQNSSKRPKLGLALSGGGAHGIAHLGVLKVMEECGLVPDVITGVSMGSIIGGMYAIGYSTDSLYKILKTTRWDECFTNVIPENKVIFHEKANFNNSILSLPFSPKKMQLPSGLINGHQIENLLGFYSWPAADISDFSKFPIPFMCLGTDIITGQKVEFRNGYLPDAIRASIAVPTIFTPVKIDTALLVDGGVVRNFAPAEAREMGADIVIGSYVGFHKFSEDELGTMTGILKQVGFLTSILDYQNQKKYADLVIEPKVKDYPSTVFSNVDSLYKRGYDAASAYRDYFKKLADSLNRIGPRIPGKPILDKEYYAFDRIIVTGNDIISDSRILGILELKPGQFTDKEFLRDKIDLIYGKNWFEKITYRIISRNDSLILQIDCREKPGSVLYGSVHYDNVINSGIVLRMNLRNIPFRGSLLYIDSFLGQNYRFRANYLTFIDDAERFGFSADFYTDNTLMPFMQIGNETGRYRSRNFSAGAGMYFSPHLNSMMMIRAGFESDIFTPDFISETRRLSYYSNSFSWQYQLNTLDRKYFPDRGVMLNTGIETSQLASAVVVTDTSRIKAERESPEGISFRRYYTLSGDLKYFFSPGRKVTFSVEGNFLFSLNQSGDLPLSKYYFLGGTNQVTRRSVPMAGFHSNQIAVSDLALAGIGFDVEFLKDLHLNINANAAVAYEIYGVERFSFLAGYSIGAGYMSVIGPVNIGLMHGISSRDRFYKAVKGFISLGFNF
ncbi:MAG: patatin-like phospholipase family protein [Bacteroidales bacterium]|nr:patatin-like phospholipase family protein [Bacteroidales bacterium]